jgi:urease accessory protein
MKPIPFLRLLQVFDSQFPVGAFVHSGGLETYAHLPLDTAGLRQLMENQVCFGWGRLDLATVCLAWRACDQPGELENLSEEVHAHKVIPSQRSSSLRLGRRMLTLLERLYPEEVRDLRLPKPHQAIVAGVFSGRVEISEGDCALAFAQSTLTALLAAATRSMEVSPGQAQEILTALQPILARQVDAVRLDPEAFLFSSTPALDIRCHQQAHLRTRLFQS